jgi:DNA-binding MarR family transcriptional regulator
MQAKDTVSVDASAAPACAAIEFYCAEGYRPEDSVGYLMRRIITLVGHGIERELEPAGLTNAQWLPLLKLYMGVASTVAELARECDLDAGSMTRLLDRLEAKALCRRVRSSDDRRVVNIELTDAGRQAAAEIPKTLCRVQNAQLAGFSTGEWRTLQGFLRRILSTAHKLQDLPEKSPADTDTDTDTDADADTDTDAGSMASATTGPAAAVPANFPEAEK